MSDEFMVKFLRVAKAITAMERGMVVNDDLDLVDALDLPQAILDSPSFSRLATAQIQRALESGIPVITNNIITDPSQAPVTNTGFSDLRVVVIFPLKGHGALYLDQHIRHGIIQRDIIDKVMSLGAYLLDNGLEDSTEREMIDLYQQIE